MNAIKILLLIFKGLYKLLFTFFLGLNTIDVTNEFLIVIFKEMKFLKNLTEEFLIIVNPLAIFSTSFQDSEFLSIPEKTEWTSLFSSI